MQGGGASAASKVNVAGAAMGAVAIGTGLYGVYTSTAGTEKATWANVGSGAVSGAATMMGVGALANALPVGGQIAYGTMVAAGAVVGAAGALGEMFSETDCERDPVLGVYACCNISKLSNIDAYRAEIGDKMFTDTFPYVRYCVQGKKEFKEEQPWLIGRFLDDHWSKKSEVALCPGYVMPASNEQINIFANNNAAVGYCWSWECAGEGKNRKGASCVDVVVTPEPEPEPVVGTKCKTEDLPLYATSGTYIKNGDKVVCAATACKSGTYLVVNSAGQSQGWCVAPSHCKDDSTHLNIIGETKTDLQCLPNDGGSTTPGNVMKISGKVWAASIDAKTNQVKEEYEIPGASIFVAETGALLLVSDTTGSFSSDKFPVGNKLKVSFIGCKDQIVSPGENLTIKLICSDNYLDDVAIESAAVGDPCVGENLMAKSVYATSGIYKRNEKGGITCTVTACSSGYEVDKVNNTCVKSTKDEKINELKNKIDLYAGNIRDIEMAHSGEKASVWKNAEGNFNTSRLLSDSIAGVALGTVGGLVVNKLVKNNHLDTGFEEIGCSIDGNRLVNFEDEFVISGAVDKNGCIGNNFGSSNVYVWASTYSDGSDYSRMVEDTNNQSNNTCWVRVDMDSDNPKIRVSDIPSRWFRVGQQVTCGSWADKSVLQKRVLDARKSARTWATVGGAVGGAGLGVGVMELFGNKLIGGAVEGQKALDEAELLYSQMSDAERQEYADANKQLKELCSELHANGGTHSACGD